MNNIFIDVDYAQIYKHGQKIGGDVFLLSRNPESNKIVCTLCKGKRPCFPHCPYGPQAEFLTD